MDFKGVNNAARRNLRCFLTSGIESADTKQEYDILTKATKVAVDELRETKIRGSTVLKNLPTLQSVIERVEHALVDAAAENNYEQDASSAKALASLLTLAALSRYGELMERKKNKKE